MTGYRAHPFTAGFDRKVLVLTGDIDRADGPDFAGWLDLLSGTGADEVIVDLAEVRRIGAGPAVLLGNFGDGLAGTGRRLRLVTGAGAGHALHLARIGTRSGTGVTLHSTVSDAALAGESTAPVAFGTTSARAGRHFLAEAYADNTMFTQGAEEGFRVHHTVRDAGAFAIAELEHSMAVDHSPTPLSRPLVCRVLDGELVRTGDGVPSVVAAGEFVLFAHPDPAGTVSKAGTRLQLIRVHPAVFAAVLAGEPLGFTGHLPVSAAAGRHLGATVDHLAEHVLGASRSSRVLTSAARLLAATVLDTFPHTVVAGPDSPLAGAIAFIERNAAADIGPAEIAGAGQVSVRALQLAFRRHLDTTPMAYLRQFRLAGARGELLAADPALDTVTAIALRWRFPHPGRFATDYRAAYGQSPSAALQDRTAMRRDAQGHPDATGTHR
ncbi:helix-turn-helix domain-containing protein [Amycolatopsis sp. 195334CR]|uniref:helix-turn-helix domain-containing protein n=1 Tax=Amycolatopsis sp. 195334CR TaxID=2814588 RepID=UPI001A8E732A|nr:helix-turn-helix domain-containing protein [Amycolatopsis sp. 195334CR]MBN6040517.1 helix-turn-helix domain-containing protein [Amycolatopsis sp. 195334CR]